MRTFGRTCRGQKKVFVRLVRQTEQQLLTVGQPVGPMALKAMLDLYEDSTVAESQKNRLHQQLQQATGQYECIERQSRRLTQGKPLAHPKIVNAYDQTIGPILKGKSNCPAQFGKKPGLIAEMATGFIFGLHLPPGNPDDASYMMPLMDQVQQAIEPMDRPRKPRIQSVAADLAFRQDPLRQQLHPRGILTVGIPSTTEPLPRRASPQQIQAVQQSMPFPQAPSAHQVQVATACGYSRPFVESLIEQLAHRGGTQLKYKGQRGAFIQTMTAILAHNAATLERIGQNRLTKRAQRFRRLFRLKPPNSLQNNGRLN
tara:strand:- start:11 stop:952 length:942 start_codon:yes stop_codon:yes gene_type:complete